MNGLVEQFHREPVDTTRSFLADEWALAGGVAGPFTASASVDSTIIEKINASKKSPIVVARGTLHSGSTSKEVVIIGHLIGALGSPRIVNGRAVTKPDEIVVDRSTKIGVGDIVTLADARHRVVGLTSNSTILAGVPLVYIELGDAQNLVFRSRTVVTGFLVRGATGPPPAGVAYRSNTEVADDTFHPLKNAIASIDLVRALLWLVAAVIIGSVVYLGPRGSRRREGKERRVCREGAAEGGVPIGCELSHAVDHDQQP